MTGPILRLPVRRLIVAVSAFAATGSATGTYAQFNFDELSVSIAPAAPTSAEPFDLRASKWFGDPGQQRIEQSITFDGNQIHVYVLMEDLHCCYFFPQVVWSDGAFFNDVGPLAAGTYRVDAEMWMRQRLMSGGTTPPVLLSTGSLTFDVVGVQNQEIVDGDYNSDGVVNAADYTLWRDTIGSSQSLDADGDGSGMIDGPDYEMWKSHYGHSAGSGSTEALSAAVPEPSSCFVLTTLLAAAVVLHRSFR